MHITHKHLQCRGVRWSVCATEYHVPLLESVGGLVEQSMIRSECVSSEIALHREAAVVSCWERPCKLAALMNLAQDTTDI